MPVVHNTLFNVLSIFQDYLADVVDELSLVPAPQLLLANIALGDTSNFPKENIILSVVKIEEEATLKNAPAHRVNPISGVREYINPPAYLNLYVMVTAHLDNYGTALRCLSQIIGYVQYHPVFRDQRAPGGEDLSTDAYTFNVSMVSPTFEQINHIWSVLGGKQLPSVLYKLQLVDILYEGETREGPLIREIVVNDKAR